MVQGKQYRVARTEDILAVHDAVVGTLRARYPGVDAHTLFDYMVMVIAAFGADLARREPNPEATAQQYGNALRDNVVHFMKQAGG